MKQVTYKDEDYNVVISVRRASLLDGMERSVMIAKGLRARPTPTEEEKASDTPSVEVSKGFLQLYTYPNCIACTTEIVNAPDATTQIPSVEELTFEEFINLPEQLTVMWLEAAIALNPRWELGFGAAPEGEASEPGSESGSTSDSLSGSNSNETETKKSTPTETTPASGS